MHPDWLSNTYLVGDEEGGTGIVIDSGGPSEPLLEAAERHGLDVKLLVLTHHHADHVAENHVWKERYGVEILAHPLEAARLLDVDRTIEPGEAGGGRRAAHRADPHPGPHGRDALADGGRERPLHRRHPVQGVGRGRAGTGLHLVRRPQALDHGRADEAAAGHHRAPRAHRSDDDRRRVGAQRLRPLWRGLDEESSDACHVGEDEATLVLWAPDYDGGHKAWVRWPDGRDDIVPGSAVTRD